MPLPGGYLLDTNIVLALVRGNPLGLYLDGTYGLTRGLNPFVISVVTVGEMFALVEKFKSQGQPWGHKKLKILAVLLRRLTWEDISAPGILRAYGEIDGFTEGKGRPMGKND